jgi:hypothetical protein
MFPLPGTPQRRPIVGLLQPEIIPLIPQDDQARIGGIAGRNQTGLHVHVHSTIVRVHGPRMTVVQQRKGAAPSEPIQPPDGKRQPRRVRRCRRTEARWTVVGTPRRIRAPAKERE